MQRGYRPLKACKAQLRAKRRLERKMRSLHKLIAHLESIEDQGYILIFTDGSSELFEGLGYVGAYGIFWTLPVSLSAPVPLHMKQTINAAELLGGTASSTAPC